MLALVIVMRIILGKFHKKKLYMPPSSITRPTAQKVKEAVFNIIQNTYAWKGEGSDVLDIFAGSGSLGFEALSLGANVCFIDNNKDAVSVIKKNINLLDVSQNACVIHAHVLALKKTNTVAATLAFLDPPYQTTLLEEALKHLAKKNWINEKTLVVCESNRIISLEQTTIKSYSETIISIGYYESNKLQS
jgi:16S rRNA (guanine966-N2)-methyltransferase